MTVLLVQMTEATAEDLKGGWGGLIFMGLFFLGLIVAGIWWLKRSA